ncbi:MULTISPECIES: hypothetical protein [Sphingobium]|uniref:hypothetical protein n=1 Tax=Sphingobium TaxID=165695 RepID=UPI0010CA79B2|nr:MULTISPECIES: hypothetical protein [Sphingobium]
MMQLDRAANACFVTCISSPMISSRPDYMVSAPEAGVRSGSKGIVSKRPEPSNPVNFRSCEAFAPLARKIPRQAGDKGNATMPSNKLTRLKRLRLKLEIDQPAKKPGKNNVRQAARSATTKAGAHSVAQRPSRATFRRAAFARAGQKG